MEASENVLSIKEWNNSPLKFFARFDGPYSNMIVNLGDHALRKILERQFEYMSRNLYFISAFGRYLLGYEREDDVVKAENVAFNTLTNGILSIEKKIHQAETLLAAEGISSSTLYGKLKTMEVPITTPGAKLYVKLLTLADRYYSLNALLWVEGIIDPKIKFGNEKEARAEIQRVLRGVASQFIFILKKTREKNGDEAAKAGTHNEEELIEKAVSEVDKASDNSMIENISGASIDNPAAAAGITVPSEGSAVPTVKEKRGTARKEVYPLEQAA